MPNNILSRHEIANISKFLSSHKMTIDDLIAQTEKKLAEVGALAAAAKPGTHEKASYHWLIGIYQFRLDDCRAFKKMGIQIP